MTLATRLDDVSNAIARSWSEATCAPGQWNPDVPAQGQCEVSSFVAWSHLGGELVLGEVFVHDEFQEDHYWNRLDGTDVDLTSAQFSQEHHIEEVTAMSSDEVRSKRPEIHAELAARIDLLAAEVDRHLR